MDYDRDGYMDAMTHFRVSDTGLTDGDSEVCMLVISNGQEFMGCDSLSASKHKRAHKKKADKKSKKEKKEKHGHGHHH